jgi:hypothetical protein
LVYIDGVVQAPVNYTIASGNPLTIVFSTAIPNGSQVVIVCMGSASKGTLDGVTINGATINTATINNLTATGTLALPVGSVTSPMILNGTIVDADINAAAAIATSKLAPVTATGSTTARTLENRFLDVINVKDFGAIGDGITDDYNAFVAAIAAAATSKSFIQLGVGTYRLRTQLTITAPITIQGVGRDTIIAFDAGNINGIRVISTAPKTILRDMQIIGAASYATLGSGVIIEANNVTVENLFVTRFNGHGILAVPPDFQEISNTNVIRCYVFDVRLLGCGFIRCVGAIVDGCKFQNTGLEGFTFDTGPYGRATPDDGTDLSQCVNSWFDNNCILGGIGAAGCDGSTGIIFSNNTVANCNDPTVGGALSDAGLFGNGFCSQNNLALSNQSVVSGNVFINCRRGVFLKGVTTPTSAPENISAGGGGFCFVTTGFKVFGNAFSGITLSSEVFRDDNPSGNNVIDCLANGSPIISRPRISLSSGSTVTSGAGSPEGVVTAPVGSLYTNTTGSTSTTLYVKTSGSGNTGWTAK